MSMSQTPLEIIEEIALACDFQSIVSLSSTCNLFNGSLMSKSFGDRFLHQSCSNLKCDITIHCQISQYDVFIFGTTQFNTPFLLHHYGGRASYTEIYLFHFTIFGEFKSKYIHLDGDYSLCLLQHEKECLICAILYPAIIQHKIDKNFRS